MIRCRHFFGNAVWYIDSFIFNREKSQLNICNFFSSLTGQCGVICPIFYLLQNPGKKIANDVPLNVQQPVLCRESGWFVGFPSFLGVILPPRPISRCQFISSNYQSSSPKLVLTSLIIPELSSSPFCFWSQERNRTEGKVEKARVFASIMDKLINHHSNQWLFL